MVALGWRLGPKARPDLTCHCASDPGTSFGRGNWRSSFVQPHGVVGTTKYSKLPHY
jgi:hypothetical protein